MNRLQKAAILVELADGLRQAGSWCGETHLQKATFFLQAFQDVPLGFDFILYKHGPFSFDLRDELTGLRADAILALEPQYPYGAKLFPTRESDHLRATYKKTLEKYRGSIGKVVEVIRDRGVAELESLATALYVTRNQVDTAMRKRVRYLRELKPHITPEDAKKALEEIDGLLDA